MSWDAQGRSHPEGQCWGGSKPGDGQGKQCPRQRVQRPWGRSWPGWSRSSKTAGEEEERSSCEDPAFSVSEMEASWGLGMEDTSTVLGWNRILSASVLRTGCRGQHGGRETCSRNSSSQMLGAWIRIVVVEMLGSHDSGYTEG